MRYLLFAGLLPLLVSCDQQAVSEPSPAPTPREVVLAQPAAPVVAPLTAPAAAPHAAAVSSAVKAPAKPYKPKPAAQPAPRAELDLSVPAEVLDELNALDTRQVQVPTPVLPPMFAEKLPAQPPLQLSGRLITGEGGDDSLEGAEVQFEFKR